MVFHTLDLILHIEESLTEEAGWTASRVIDRLAYLGVNHLDNTANQWTRRVILTTIAACITHSLDIAFIKHRHFVLVLSTLEVEFINHIDDLTHIESGTYLVMQFAKNLAYLIFKTIRLSGGILEVFEVWEKLLIDKLHQVVATHGVDGVEYHLARLRVFLLGRCPLAPTIETRNKSLVGLAIKFSFFLTFCFKIIEVFQEQHPWFLLQIVQLTTTPLLLPEYLINCFECIFVFHVSSYIYSSNG